MCVVELVGRGSRITQTRFQGVARLRPHGVRGLCARRAADPARESIQTCGRNLQWAIILENAGTNGSAAAERIARCVFDSTGALRKLSGLAGARLRQAYGAAGPRPTSWPEARLPAPIFAGCTGR